MGACSSKPKTTEFDGSMAPSKETEEVAADQLQAKERSLDVPMDEKDKEVPAKTGGDEGSSTTAATEATQTEWELDAPKDEGAEIPVDAVTLDDEKLAETETALKTPVKRSLVVQQEEMSGVLNESPGVESPIIGVVLPVDSPMVDVAPSVEPSKEDDVLECVATEPQKDVADVTMDAHESKVVLEGLLTDKGDEELHSSAKAAVTEPEVDASTIPDLHMDCVQPARGASSAAIGGSGLEKLAPGEGDPLKELEELALQLQVEAAEDDVESASPATTDSQVEVKESARDTEPSAALDEPSTGREIDDDPKLEAPKMPEAIDPPEACFIGVKAEDKELESLQAEGKPDLKEEESLNKVLVPTIPGTEISNGQAQGLPSGDSAENGKPKDMVAPESEKKIVQGLVLSTEAGVEKMQIEHTASDNVTFEDASDAPLKPEVSKSIE